MREESIQSSCITSNEFVIIQKGLPLPLIIIPTPLQNQPCLIEAARLYSYSDYHQSLTPSILFEEDKLWHLRDPYSSSFHEVAVQLQCYQKTGVCSP